MNALRIINQVAEQKRAPQVTIRGVVIGRESTRYRVQAGGNVYTAESGIAQALETGDRVMLVIGWGNPAIIGLHGKDQNIS